MPNYRRSDATGATYFFTLVSYQRQPILCDEAIRNALHKAVKDTQRTLPFIIDAWVLMPDHLHCLWTLPKDDADFSFRWQKIKQQVSRTCAAHYKHEELLTPSKLKYRESTIWQRRFWEHQIRDQRDFNNHMDYIHYNPVKHQLCERPNQWQWSTFHRFVKAGKYTEGWALNGSISGDAECGE